MFAVKVALTKLLLFRKRKTLWTKKLCIGAWQVAMNSAGYFKLFVVDLLIHRDVTVNSVVLWKRNRALLC
jgi:hypothetical protein